MREVKIYDACLLLGLIGGMIFRGAAAYTFPLYYNGCRKFDIKVPKHCTLKKVQQCVEDVTGIIPKCQKMKIFLCSKTGGKNYRPIAVTGLDYRYFDKSEVQSEALFEVWCGYGTDEDRDQTLTLLSGKVPITFKYVGEELTIEDQMDEKHRHGEANTLQKLFSDMVHSKLNNVSLDVERAAFSCSHCCRELRGDDTPLGSACLSSQCKFVVRPIVVKILPPQDDILAQYNQQRSALAQLTYDGPQDGDKLKLHQVPVELALDNEVPYDQSGLDDGAGIEGGQREMKKNVAIRCVFAPVRSVMDRDIVLMGDALKKLKELQKDKDILQSARARAAWWQNATRYALLATTIAGIAGIASIAGKSPRPVRWPQGALGYIRSLCNNNMLGAALMPIAACSAGLLLTHYHSRR